MQRLFNEIVSVSRMTDITESGIETGKKSWQTHIASLPCHVQPNQASLSQDIQYGFGKDLILFCDANDIIEGDKIIRDGIDYNVTGVELLSFLTESHMEITIRVFKS